MIIDSYTVDIQPWNTSKGTRYLICIFSIIKIKLNALVGVISQVSNWKLLQAFCSFKAVALTIDVHRWRNHCCQDGKQVNHQSYEFTIGVHSKTHDNHRIIQDLIISSIVRIIFAFVDTSFTIWVILCFVKFLLEFREEFFWLHLRLLLFAAYTDSPP